MCVCEDVSRLIQDLRQPKFEAEMEVRRLIDPPKRKVIFMKPDMISITIWDVDSRD